METHWQVWFQHSDYDTDELGELSIAEATAKFGEIDIQKESESMLQRISDKQDWCQFGLGFNSPDRRLAHFYVEEGNAESVSFCLRLERHRTKKLLGLIPIPHTQTKEIEGLKCSSVPFYIEKIYSNFDGLFD